MDPACGTTPATTRTVPTPTLRILQGVQGGNSPIAPHISDHYTEPQGREAQTLGPLRQKLHLGDDALLLGSLSGFHRVQDDNILLSHLKRKNRTWRTSFSCSESYRGPRRVNAQK